MSWLLPSLVQVRLVEGTMRWPSLWVPVFLLWPLWLVALLVVFVALALLGARAGTIAGAFRATCGLHLLVCALRGGRCELQFTDRALSLAIV
jgi:hypothetical protein